MNLRKRILELETKRSSPKIEVAFYNQGENRHHPLTSEGVDALEVKNLLIVRWLE